MLITGTTYDNDRLYKCYLYDESQSETATPSQTLYRVLDIISMVLHNLEIYESDRDLFVHWAEALKMVRQWMPPKEPCGSDEDVWRRSPDKVCS